MGEPRNTVMSGVKGIVGIVSFGWHGPHVPGLLTFCVLWAKGWKSTVVGRSPGMACEPFGESGIMIGSFLVPLGMFASSFSFKILEKAQAGQPIQLFLKRDGANDTYLRISQTITEPNE